MGLQDFVATTGSANVDVAAQATPCIIRSTAVVISAVAETICIYDF